MSEVGEIQAVTFGLGAEIFAVPVMFVKEILDYRETFHIPNGPDYLLGLTDLRGQGVTTIDFRLRLGLPRTDPTSATRILVIEVPLADRVLVLGLVVDRVIEVGSFRSDQIEGAPDIGMPWSSDYIAGVVRKDETFIVIVDVEAVFARDGQAEDWAASAAAA
jgi:purine-binding chemotaxis protein CheW